MSELTTTNPNANPKAYDDMTKEEQTAFDAKERAREKSEQAGKHYYLQKMFVPDLFHYSFTISMDSGFTDCNGHCTIT